MKPGIPNYDWQRIRGQVRVICVIDAQSQQDAEAAAGSPRLAFFAVAAL
jgi:hypothetical protein